MFITVYCRLPNLRLLDFKKIKEKERLEAVNLFKSKKGKEMQKEIAKKAKLIMATNGSELLTKAKGKFQNGCGTNEIII